MNRRSAGFWALAVLVILMGAALGVALRSRPPNRAPIIRALIPPPERTVFNSDPITPGPPVVSPDGLHIVFAAQEEDGAVRLWLRSLHDLDATPIAGTEGGGYPFWSPDGKSIGFFSKGGLNRVDLALGRVLKLCEAPTGKGGTWGRDGTILFAPSFNSGIHRVSDAGGNPVPVTSLSKSDGEYSHRFPYFFPDGRQFLYMAQFEDFGARSPAIMVAPLDGGHGQRIAAADSHAIFAGGHLLYLLDENLIAQPFDPASLETMGEARRIVESVARIPGTGRGVFSASEQGVLVYERIPGKRAIELRWVDRDGAVVKTLADLPSPFSSVAVSPDGERIAIALHGASGQEQDIWLIDADTGRKSRFTFGADAFNAIWMPDGESLLFSAHEDGVNRVSRRALNGSDMASLDVPLGIPISSSPDGSFLGVMVAGEGTGADIWFVPLSADREPRVYLNSRNLEVQPQISPDGKWIAYATDETGMFEVYVGSMEDASRRWQISTNGGRVPLWRSDGKELYFLSPASVLVAVRLETGAGVVNVTTSEELFKMDAYLLDNWEGYGVSPDGGRFLIQSFKSGQIPSVSSLILVTDWRASETG